jgi:hypothetical protein
MRPARTLGGTDGAVVRPTWPAPLGSDEGGAHEDASRHLRRGRQNRPPRSARARAVAIPGQTRGRSTSMPALSRRPAATAHGESALSRSLSKGEPLRGFSPMTLLRSGATYDHRFAIPFHVNARAAGRAVVGFGECRAGRVWWASSSWARPSSWSPSCSRPSFVATIRTPSIGRVW